MLRALETSSSDVLQEVVLQRKRPEPIAIEAVRAKAPLAEAARKLIDMPTTTGMTRSPWTTPKSKSRLIRIGETTITKDDSSRRK
jgi:hypothetical protein